MSGNLCGPIVQAGSVDGIYFRGPASSASEQLEQAAQALADAVQRQWTEEAALRSLRDPDPLRVRWSETGRPVTPPPTAVWGPGKSVGRLPRHGDPASAVELLRKIPSRQLVVIGEPESGKTVLAVLLLLALLDRPLAGEPVPVLLNASQWNPHHEHLDTWLARRLTEEYPALTNKTTYGADALRRLVERRRVMVILDGLDEMPASLHMRAINALNRAAAAGRPLVVTCRSAEYQAAVDKGGTVLARAAVVEMEPVELRAVAEFLTSTGATAPGRWQPVLDRLLAQPDLPLAQALRSPLMVALARTVYTASSTDPAELLETEAFIGQADIERHLLDAFVPAAYRDDPAPPGTPSASVRVRYEPAKALDWLRFLACHLDRCETHEFAWWQLVRAAPPPQRGLLAGVVQAILFGFVGELAIAMQMTALFYSLGYALVFGTAGGLCYALGRMATPSYVEIRFRGTVGGFVRRFAAGFVTALVLGLGFGLSVGLALSLGLVFGLTFGSHMFLDTPTDATKVSSPTVVLRRDRTATLVFGLSFGISFGLTGGLVFGFEANLALTTPELVLGTVSSVIGGGILGAIGYGRVGAIAFGLASGSLFFFTAGVPYGADVNGVALGLAYGAAFGLATGSACVLARAWGAFTLSRTWFALRGRLPWRLMTFLDDAHRRGVLRQAGGVYQFRHARLQDRLAGSVQGRSRQYPHNL